MGKPVLPWMVSLHGGHSGEFCDHAEGTLRELLETAVEVGYHTFGVSEHAPRNAERFLYSEEKRRGWDLAKVQADFARYRLTVQEVVEEFADRLIVLRGFEIEVVPEESYVTWMRGYWEQPLSDGMPAFDYTVGSVHYVDGFQIDGPPENFLKGVAAFGSAEALAVRYYTLIAEMIEALHPAVVGHLDLIKRNAELAGVGTDWLTSPAVVRAVEQTLEAVRTHKAILDLNTAGWRKGLGEPYPAPWLVQRAYAMGVPFCFGDDSHRVSDIGKGLPEAREYLLSLGVPTITVLTREGKEIVRRTVSLL